ncbi:hypothetical protein D3C81_1624930 [compost metagenome]
MLAWLDWLSMVSCRASSAMSLPTSVRFSPAATSEAAMVSWLPALISTLPSREAMAEPTWVVDCSALVLLFFALL